MDKEEIIRRLKKISGHAVHVVGEPPFVMSLDDGIALGEAVRLLKEQKAEHVKIVDGDHGKTHWYACGGCKSPINPGDRYCHECGRALKWE